MIYLCTLYRRYTVSRLVPAADCYCMYSVTEQHLEERTVKQIMYVESTSWI